MKTYVVTPHYNRLDKTDLMMAHKICFSEEIWIIITKLSLLLLLIWSPVLLRVAVLLFVVVLLNKVSVGLKLQILVLYVFFVSKSL